MNFKAPSSDATGAQSARSKKGLTWLRGPVLQRELQHVNEEIYRRNLELAQTNKTLALLQAIDSVVLSDDGELRTLARKLCHEVMKTAYDFVAILGRAEEEKWLDIWGWAMPGAPRSDVKLSKIKLHSNLDWLKGNEILQLMPLSQLSDQQIAEYCNVSEIEARSIREGIAIGSACCIRLNAPQGTLGLMVIGFADQLDKLSEFDETLFQRLSEVVGIALDRKILLDENRRTLAQLEHSNQRLRVLDRTKDDFISMASHQLRTPLTSVKGYVSMVLDGDGGKITETQRKLLTQSFVSAQRMVYLISDLLNVSRLKTGKFLIEPVESNLAKVVDEELEQLTETIKSRNLLLTYSKPQHFPTLMLDETKIRQVIMNFVDNAIYYTPSGGEIEVHLVERPESVEFTVVDNGIGVPKHEQHHLFDKFYRAKNAQNARPDGTGLGLYMAKKVIIAQGGAIIFKSTEGKGSTFGFTFPKAHLLPTAAPKAELAAH